MALTLNKTPKYLSLSGNQIIIGVYSDNIYSASGVANVIWIQIEGVANAATFILSWGTTSLTFTFKDTPYTDGVMDGLQLRSGTGYTDYSALAIVNAEYFEHNADILDNFYVSRTGSKIYFTAREPGEDYKMIVSDHPAQLTHGSTASGADAILRDVYQIFCNIAVNNFPLNTEAIEPDTTGQVDFYVEELINDYLLSLAETTQDYRWPEDSTLCLIKRANLCKIYTARYCEAYGQPQVKKYLYKSDDFYVLSGGISKETESYFNSQFTSFWEHLQSTMMFLSWKPKTLVIDRLMPEKLYFLNWSGASQLLLRYKYYTASLPYGPFTKQTVAAENMQVYECIVSPAQLSLHMLAVRMEVWLEDQNGTRVSEIRYYKFDSTEYPQKRYFMFRNSFNVMEPIRATGEAIKENDYENIISSINLPAVPLPSDRTLIQTRGIEIQNYKTNFGWVDYRNVTPDDYINWMRDFMLSPERHEIIGDKLYPIIITSGKMTPHKDNQYLYALEMEYRRAYADEYYSTPNVNELVFDDSFNDSFLHENNLNNQSTL